MFHTLGGVTANHTFTAQETIYQVYCSAIHFVRLALQAFGVCLR